MLDCHYAIMHNEDIDIDESLQQRIDGWIQWRSKLASRDDSVAVVNQEWLDYDIEGREIAAHLLPALGADAEVYYFSEARKEYELLVPKVSVLRP